MATDSITDTILNAVNNTTPQAWLNALEAIKDGKRIYSDAQVAQALQAYLEHMAPKTLQELVELSKNKASEAQVWISILPPDTKSRFVSELESVISSLTPAQQAQTQSGTTTDASKVDLKKWFAIFSKEIVDDEPDYVGPSIIRLLQQIQSHSKLNTKMPGNTETWQDEIKKIIRLNKSKFNPEDYKKVNQILIQLQDKQEPVTESYNIASQIKALMSK